jgi:hypothetical protein
LDERYILEEGPVIYAANYLTPKPYTKGELLNISYPMTQKMRCGDLVLKKDQPACPGGDMDTEIIFNKDFLRKLAAPFSAFSQKYDVPLWVDQVRLLTCAPDLAGLLLTSLHVIVCTVGSARSRGRRQRLRLRVSH